MLRFLIRDGWPRTLGALVATVVLSSLAAAPSSAADKPNILIIWGDDVGMWNISAYHRGMMGGSTPNIDSIAADGMQFANAYSANPVCSPTRASLMTGRWCYRTRVVDTWIGRSMMDPDEVTIGMPLEMVTRKLRTDGEKGVIIYGYKFRPVLEQNG